MKPLSSRSRGFTLIELLVVMAIIATLASLGVVAIPNFLRMRDKTKCADNLKQIHALLRMYEVDHKGMPTADGSAFVLAIWGGGGLDKGVQQASLFFCPSTNRHPEADLSNVTPEGIDYTGPELSGRYSGRNRLSSASANAFEIPIASNKLPNPSDILSEEQRHADLPHAGKGFTVLYLGGTTEFIDAGQFPDDLPVIGPESPIEKFRILRPGFDG